MEDEQVGNGNTMKWFGVGQSTMNHARELRNECFEYEGKSKRSSDGHTFIGDCSSHSNKEARWLSLTSYDAYGWINELVQIDDTIDVITCDWNSPSFKNI